LRQLAALILVWVKNRKLSGPGEAPIRSPVPAWAAGDPHGSLVKPYRVAGLSLAAAVANPQSGSFVSLTSSISLRLHQAYVAQNMLPKITR
jgi:hypothetical protein